MTRDAMGDTCRRIEVYLRIWIGAMDAFLGWPEERTRKWAQERWGDYLGSDENALRKGFFHDQPELYVANLVMRHCLSRPLIGAKRSQLARRLAFAMRDPERTKNLSEFDKQDWQAARGRIIAILLAYGATLPIETSQESVGRG